MELVAQPRKTSSLTHLNEETGTNRASAGSGEEIQHSLNVSPDFAKDLEFVAGSDGRWWREHCEGRGGACGTRVGASPAARVPGQLGDLWVLCVCALYPPWLCPRGRTVLCPWRVPKQARGCVQRQLFPDVSTVLEHSCVTKTSLGQIRLRVRCQPALACGQRSASGCSFSFFSSPKIGSSGRQGLCWAHLCAPVTGTC